MDNNIYPDFTFYCHSQNFTGAENIKSYLDCFIGSKRVARELLFKFGWGERVVLTDSIHADLNGLTAIIINRTLDTNGDRINQNYPNTSPFNLYRLRFDFDTEKNVFFTCAEKYLTSYTSSDNVLL